MLNKNLINIVLVICFIITILLLVFTRNPFIVSKTESFYDNNLMDNVSLDRKFEELYEKKFSSIQKDLSDVLNEELKGKYEEINLPLILTDENNLCLEWRRGEMCAPDSKRRGQYSCQNPGTQLSRNPEKEYCNNWMSGDIQKNQKLNIEQIVFESITSLRPKILEDFNEIERDFILNKDLLEKIKQSQLLFNNQAFFVDNNENNLKQKNEIVKDIEEKLEDYDNNITSNKYVYEAEIRKQEKLKKYHLWTKYITITLGVILGIIIVFNILFTRIN